MASIGCGEGCEGISEVLPQWETGPHRYERHFERKDLPVSRWRRRPTHSPRTASGRLDWRMLDFRAGVAAGRGGKGLPREKRTLQTSASSKAYPAPRNGFASCHG